MCRRGWTNCDNGDFCLGGLDENYCCCYPDGYVPYVHRQAGWDVVLAVVYDDVCGKQAMECWMQASGQKQEVKRGTTQQTRLGERVRWTTPRGVELHADDYILRRIIAKQCKWLRGSCARGKRRWRGRGWRLSRCAGKHFMLALTLGRHTMRGLSNKCARVEPTFYHASCLLTFLQRLDFPTSPPGTGLHEDELMRLV